MQIILYFMSYVIGILLGSFFTLATYRIPLKQDITRTRSYCPNCNHRLEFLDLIPVLSYIFLKGKCRYCKSKINSRYIIIELFSGFVYLLFVMSIKINIFDFANIIIMLQLLLATILLCILFIIGGIAKENNKISKSVIVSGIIIVVTYITYLYIFKLDVHRYIICLSILISSVIVLLMRVFKMDKMNKTSIYCFGLIVIWIICNFYII